MGEHRTFRSVEKFGISLSCDMYDIWELIWEPFGSIRAKRRILDTACFCRSAGEQEKVRYARRLDASLPFQDVHIRADRSSHTA